MGAAGRRTVAAACGTSEADSDRCSVTHQACGVGKTGGADVGVQTGLVSGRPDASHAHPPVIEYLTIALAKYVPQYLSMIIFFASVGAG